MTAWGRNRTIAHLRAQHAVATIIDKNSMPEVARRMRELVADFNIRRPITVSAIHA